MHVLVTGSTGFIGRHVIDQLLGKKFKITSIIRKKIREKNNINYIYCDLNKSLKKLNYINFKKIDLLIHLAWSGLPNHNSKHHIDVNLKNNKKFLSFMIKKGIGRIMVFGTCSELGKKKGGLNEKTSSNPLNYYGKSKDLLRKWIFKKFKNKKITIQWVRLFYIYGPGQHEKALLPSLDFALKKKKKTFKMSGGEQKRDFLHVKEVAKKIVKVAERKNLKGIIHICKGKSIKVKTLVKNYLSKKRKKIKIQYGYYPYNKLESMNFWGIDSKSI